MQTQSRRSGPKNIHAPRSVSFFTVCLISLQALHTCALENKTPAALLPIEARNTEIFAKYKAAVVGLTCKGQMHGQPVGFTGAGAVISADGLILSNITAIPNDAHDIKVMFADGRVLSGERVQTEEKCEGALIKVNASNLTCMKVANSQQYKVGDPVFTWGSPFNSIQRDGGVSFSAGTITGLYSAASIDDESSYVGPAIETDAAINPSADGGPLTDTEGQLIGVLSMGYTRTRWMGLAIPSAHLAASLEKLKPLLTAQRAEPSGTALAPAEALHAALAEAAAKADKAVITLRIVREKDDESVPLDFKTMDVKAPTTTDDNARNINESDRPENAFVSAFLITADGKALTSYFNVGETPGHNPHHRGHPSLLQLEDAPETPVPAPKPDAPPTDAPKADAAKPEAPKSNKVVKIYAYLADGKRVEAHIMGVHKANDLALLQLDLPTGTATPHLNLGSPDLKVGSAIAILGRAEPPGNLTVNSGQVCSLHRHRETCCQINALLNYGNSGGPVIDLDGNVVGMAAQLGVNTEWRQNCGVGFMLNSALIRQALPDLVAGKALSGKRPGFLGIGGASRPQPSGGTLVTEVVPGSAAQKCGLQVGDAIVEFNGVKISDFEGLCNVTYGLNEGDVVKLKIRRAGQVIDKSATLSGRRD